MNSTVAICLVTTALACAAGAQEAKPPLTKGVSVKMPTASHALEVRAADEEGATIVSVTADGATFVGTQAADVGSLSRLKKGVVYVKADARVPYQHIVTVLDALQGRPVVLLTASAKAKNAKLVPPRGVKLTVESQ